MPKKKLTLAAVDKKITSVQTELRQFKLETNERFDKLEKRFDQLEAKIDKLFDHIDKNIEAYVENRASDLLGVKHDEVHMMKQQIQSHEIRIKALER